MQSTAPQSTLMIENGTVSWVNEKMHVDGLITVKSDGELIIDNSVVLFSPQSRIYVEPGGLLHIKNCSYLSSIYDDAFYSIARILWKNTTFPIHRELLWDGIVVFGAGDEPQEGVSPSIDSPTMGLVLVENSTISHANEAIISRNPIVGNWQGYPGPGVIRAINSNFYNNYTSINAVNPYNDRSHFIEDCLFTQSESFVGYYEVFVHGHEYYEGCSYEIAAPYQITNPLEDWSSASTLHGGIVSPFQVVVRSANDFAIEGNRFESQTIYSRPYGGGIKVTNTGLSIGPDSADFEDARGNTFFRLAHAIDSYGYNDCLSNLKVMGNTFINNIRSVTLNANPMSVLQKNYFKARISDGLEIPYLGETNIPIPPEYFVFANESFACNVTENEFSSNMSTPNVSIIVAESMSQVDTPAENPFLVRHNLFEGSLLSCVDVLGDNQGINLSCNRFDIMEVQRPASYFYFADTEEGSALQVQELGNCNSGGGQFRAIESAELLNDNSFTTRVVLDPMASQAAITFNSNPTSLFPINNSDPGVISNPCDLSLETGTCQPDLIIETDGGPVVAQFSDDIKVVAELVNEKDKETYRSFLDANDELWTDRLLINQLVSAGDSLDAETKLAEYPSETTEQTEYKEVMIAINRSETDRISAKTNGLYSLTSSIANDPDQKMQSIAQSGMAANWGANFQRYAPKRSIVQSISKPAQATIECLPNPAQLLTVVKIKNGSSIEPWDKVIICDLYGNQWLEIKAEDCLWDEKRVEVDLSNLNNGIYLVSIEGKAKPTKMVVSK